MEKGIYIRYAKLQSKFRMARQKWDETTQKVAPFLSVDLNLVLNDFGKCLVIDPALTLPVECKCADLFIDFKVCSLWMFHCLGPPACPTSSRHHQASNSALVPILESVEDGEEENVSSEQEKTAAKKTAGKENMPFESSSSKPGTSSARAPKRHCSQIYEGFSNLNIRGDKDDENSEPVAQRIKRYI